MFSLDAYYIQHVNITKLNETSWNLTCQYKPLSDPNGCVITVHCATPASDGQATYEFRASNENDNSSYSTAVTFHCSMLQCSTYIFQAYDIYLDSEQDISKNPAVTKQVLEHDLCQANPSTLAKMLSRFIIS